MAQTDMNGSAPVVLASNQSAIPINDNSGSITVDGSLTVVQGTGSNLHAVIDSGTITTVTNTVHVDDNSASLTVDNPTLSVVGGGTEATAQRVTIASDSTGLLSIDDNGGSLTVDGSVAVTQATGTNLHTVVDSGTIGTITNVVHVDDNSGTLTIDNTTLSVVGNGTAATAQRVTLASDSTGKVSVNGSVAATQSGTWNITNLTGTQTLPTGASTESTLAAASAKLPASLGSKASASSLSVTLASDQVALPVSLSTPAVATYSAVILGLSPAASATDVLTITGSASKTVSITAISINGISTTAGSMKMQLLKRSTADTGGTSAAVTAVSFDSSDGAATATVSSYTSNPTLGTAVGPIEVFVQGLPSTAMTFGDQGNDFAYGAIGKPIILRGTSQVLALNLNGASAPTGTSLDVKITWTEA